MLRPLLFALGLSIAACGGSVQSASGGSGGANVDEECFEACVECFRIERRRDGFREAEGAGAGHRSVSTRRDQCVENRG